MSHTHKLKLKSGKNISLTNEEYDELMELILTESVPSENHKIKNLPCIDIWEYWMKLMSIPDFPIYPQYPQYFTLPTYPEDWDWRSPINIPTCTDTNYN